MKWTEIRPSKPIRKLPAAEREFWMHALLIQRAETPAQVDVCRPALRNKTIDVSDEQREALYALAARRERWLEVHGGGR